MKNNKHRGFFLKIKMNYTHFKVLVKRYFELIFNDKSSFIMLMLQVPIMLIIVTLVCPRNSFSTAKNLWLADTAIFIVVCIASIMGLLNSYREVTKEKEIFLREYESGLDVTAYIMSKVFVLGTIAFCQSALLVAGSYLIIDWPTVTVVATQLGFFLIVFLVMFSSISIGLFISCILKNAESAILPVLFLIIAQVVLSGAFIAIDDNMSLVSNIVVCKWGIAALGKVFNRNAMFDGLFPNANYNEPLLLCIAVLVGMSILLIAIAILWLKAHYKKRKK